MASTKNYFAALVGLSEDMLNEREESNSNKDKEEESHGNASRSQDGNEQRTDNAAMEASAVTLAGTTCAEPSHAPEISSRVGGLTNGSPGISKSGLRHPLVWLDLEMTGLDFDRDTIIEAACLITDGELETVMEGPSFAIHHSDDVLDSMNPWSIDHHGASGLTQRCRDSTTSMADGEEQLLDFVVRHTDAGEARLAGNSVHVDMHFLRRCMPRLFAHLSHRIVDVSTVGELCARWFPREHKRAPRKKAAHTALEDIRESLEELRYYKKAIFKEQGHLHQHSHQQQHAQQQRRKPITGSKR